MFSLLFNAERKFLTLLFCPLLLLPSPASSLSPSLSFAVLLPFFSESPGVVRSDLLPSRPPLPPHAHARLHPVPDPQQPHAHPAGARGPVSEQTLLLHVFFLLPSLLLRLLPVVLAQLPVVPLQHGEPRLPALLALPPSPADHPLTSLPHDGESPAQLGLGGHPGVRGHGVSGRGAFPCPLPIASPASVDHGEPTQQRRRPPSKEGGEDR